MDWRLELVAIPVPDVERAKAFFVEKAGFHADHDHQVNDELRFVQLSPLSCALCSSARPAQPRSSSSSPTSRPPARSWSTAVST